MTDPSLINVLFLAAEADPLIKVGGLGDVAGSLPPALRRLTPDVDYGRIKLDIRLVIPYHPAIQLQGYTPQFVAEFPVRAGKNEIIAKVYSIEIEGLPVYLVSGTPIDQETAVYSLDLEADGYKYVFFSIAALILGEKIHWKPDIYHANDWHTATAVYALSLRRHDHEFYKEACSLLTIHNLPYLGSMTSAALAEFGLPPAIDSDLPPWAQDMALPLGLLAADEIVAVSPGYSSEIMTEEYGSGLSEFLSARESKIRGILNGLDISRWDPYHDKALTRNYSVTSLEDRQYNKSFLQEELKFEIHPRVPLLAMITRMDPQKGVDLAINAVREVLRHGGDGSQLQAIFLGTGDPTLEDLARRLEHDFPKQVRARIVYDEQLSRRIYAGADALLMPSRYEPCGLSQMIAMRYGCIPIARATGGLSDTIHDPLTSEEATGFLFTNPKTDELVKAVRRALRVYSEHPLDWRNMMVNGMRQDFSWDHSAREYLKRYRALIRT